MSAAESVDRSAVERLLRIGGPSLASQMVQLYLSQGPERMALLEEGVATGQGSQVQRAAHALKSSAGNVGAVHVQREAEAVERGAAAGSIDGDAVRRLRDRYDASELVLRRLLEEMGT